MIWNEGGQDWLAISFDLASGTAKRQPALINKDIKLAFSVESIRARAELLRELRKFFDQRDFLEVQPPCLSRDCVVDAYLEPIRIDSQQFQLGGMNLPDAYYLQTSPESMMKRMLVDGAPSIYSIGPVFRAGERGAMHNIEFSMLEWYDLGASMADEIRLLGELACQILGRDRYDVRTYREVFGQTLGFDPIDSPIEIVAAAAELVTAELTADVATDRDALIDLLMSQAIQPHLGSGTPLIVKDYPLTQAALARQSEDRDCAARFELFVDGVEVANGYDELLDPDQFLSRAQENNAKRMAAGRGQLLEQTSLWAAMKRGLAPCAGVALGVDRLLMLRVGATSIDEVIAFPIEKA